MFKGGAKVSNPTNRGLQHSRGLNLPAVSKGEHLVFLITSHTYEAERERDEA